MIILDFETNSTNIHDVIEVAAFRVALVNNTYNLSSLLLLPQAIETCKYYHIDFDNEQYHSAIYDVTKTLEILNRMECEVV